MYSNSEKAIIVDGVVLTGSLLRCLKSLQECDNEIANHVRERLSDAICFIGINSGDSDVDEIRESKELMQELSFIRGYFKDFKKP